MRFRRIPDLIDRLYGRIYRCIKANRIIGTGDIVIYGTRNADRRQRVLLKKGMRSFKSSVTAYQDQAVYMMFFKLLKSFLTSRNS